VPIVDVHTRFAPAETERIARHNAAGLFGIPDDQRW
jgi:hypothetical protein